MKSLKKFSKNLVEELVNQLHHYENHHDEETLHQIRVDVKKMKAIINLVVYSKKKFKGHQMFIPFRNIFRKAGAIREREVFRKLLTGKLVKKTKSGKVIVTPPMETFMEDIPFFIDSIEKEWRKLKPQLAKVSKEDFKHFISQKYNEIEEHLMPKPNMKEIHRTRKAIKAVVYLSKVKNNLPEKDKVFFADMEETIGQLHDKQVLLVNVKKGNHKADKKQLSKLKASCDSNKQRITRLASNYYGSK